MNTLSSLNNEIIKKIGNENVIFYSKAYISKNNSNKLSYNELITIINNQKKTNKTNDSVFLYFLCEYDSKKIDDFYNQISYSHNISIEDLYLMFNILEFEDTYHKRNINQLITLYNSFNKLAELNKTKNDYILFFYYKALINFLCGNIKKTKEKCNILVYEIEEKEINDTIIKDYFKLKVKFLLWKVLIEEGGLNNINEINTIYSDLDTQIENKFERIKFKFKNLEIINKHYSVDLNQKINDLNDIYQQLKIISIEGNYELKNSCEIYLSILSHLAFYYSLKQDNINLKKILKKINKNLNIYLPERNLANFIVVDSTKNSISNIYFKEKYLFYLLCLKHSVFGIKNNIEDNCISCLYKNKKNDILTGYNNFFKEIQKNNSQTLSYSNYINSNLINYFIINNSNPHMRKFQELSKQYEKLIEDNNLNNENEIILAITCLFNIISNFSNSYINDPNKEKQNEYLFKIKAYSFLIINFLSKLSKNKDLKCIFSIELIQNIFIQSYFCFSYFFLSTKDYKATHEKLVEYFNKYTKVISKDNFFNFLMFKLYGDYNVSQNNYSKALKFYKEALNFFDTQRKINYIFENKRAALFYNIGYCFIKSGNVIEGKQYIEYSFAIYSKLLSIDNSPENQKNSNKLKMIIAKFIHK